MTKNKIHLLARELKSLQRQYRALCGVDSGGNRKNIVPRSKEARDVTCKRCKRILKLRAR